MDSVDVFSSVRVVDSSFKEDTTERKAEDAGYVDAFASVGSKSEGKSEVKSEGRSEGKSEGKSEVKSEGRSEGKSEVKSDGKSEGKSEGKSKGVSREEKARSIFGDVSIPDTVLWEEDSGEVPAQEVAAQEEVKQEVAVQEEVKQEVAAQEIKDCLDDIARAVKAEPVEDRAEGKSEGRSENRVEGKSEGSPRDSVYPADLVDDEDEVKSVTNVNIVSKKKHSAPEEEGDSSTDNPEYFKETMSTAAEAFKSSMADVGSAVGAAVGSIGSAGSSILSRTLDPIKGKRVQAQFKREREYKSGKFAFKLHRGEAMITKYLGGSRIVDVPCAINLQNGRAIPVRYIHSNFLYGNFVDNYNTRQVANALSRDLGRGMSNISLKDICEVHLPEGLVAIFAKTFSGCSGIVNVIIPSTVVYLAPTAFSNSGITDIYFNGDAPSNWDREMFAGYGVHVLPEYKANFCSAI